MIVRIGLLKNHENVEFIRFLHRSDLANSQNSILYSILICLFGRLAVFHLVFFRFFTKVPTFRLAFNRTGNMSKYGDLSVEHISPSGKKTDVGQANGISIYTPNAIRRFTLNLRTDKGVDFRSGKLHATYSAPSDAKKEVYAEGEMDLK